MFLKIIEFTIRNDLASKIRIHGSSFHFSSKKERLAFSSGIYLQILHGMKKEEKNWKEYLDFIREIIDSSSYDEIIKENTLIRKQK